MKKVVIAVLLVICTFSSLYAAQSIIVDTDGTACMGDVKSRKQIETEALANAKKKATECAFSYVRSETSIKNLQLERDLIDAYSNSTVKIIQELEKIWFKGANSGDCYRIKIKAEIVPDEETLEKAFRDEGFADNPAAPLKVQIWTEKQIYKQGEKIKIYLKGNKPFHARILYKDATGHMLQILPNPYHKDNYFHGGVVYELPDGDKDRFHLEVSPPFGTELIILHASTVPLGDLELEAAGGVYSVNTEQRDIWIKSRALKITGIDRLEGFSASRPFIAEFVESSMELKTLGYKSTHNTQRDVKPENGPVVRRRIWDVKDYALIEVFYATDRNVTGNTKPTEIFGSSRSTLSYGTCVVSIPRDHRMGELESPSITKLEVSEDETKHVILREVIIQNKDDFFADMAVTVKASAKASAFLFVHGYNVPFAEAARRTGQIAYDLGFDGAPVFYSWPSQGLTLAYTIDERTIEWTQNNLKNFLQEFFERSNAQNVYVIAHSMGNRAMTRAIASFLAENPSQRPRLKEIILAAPDIDADVFKKNIAPELAAAGRPVTLYASSADLALTASKKFHGYPRAGDSGEGLVITAGIETIDATGVDTSFMGHSYYAEARSVLSDIFYLIRNSQRANDRFGLKGVDTKVGRYWIFKK